MILLDVKQYLRERAVCNLQELSLHFQRDPVVMRDMLSHWVKKGVVVKDQKPITCGIKCVQCKPDVAEVYRFNS